MYFVEPNDSEKVALRLLLLHRKGVMSFEDLKTVDGVSYESFQKAAYQLGLMDGNIEWESVLADAASTITNISDFRELFVTILLNCQPSNPLDLWEKFKKPLSEDFYHSIATVTQNLDEEYLSKEAFNLCLQHKDLILMKSAKETIRYHRITVL